ncbi:hypothetical protein EDC18_103279 [Natranaerovirga pectinivora]|uniref:Uncharacterized protein n=1 Tax=Natranaerovirga pectinivora TaxID=682400 RepID=A0A4R3MMQ2_9FIRM|nr:hypothetical protein [Natranaerovirga pectinivora]TCT15573.1 hypothetical protein EDC18_103279 [Natranaerovirga pectinivora]
MNKAFDIVTFIGLLMFILSIKIYHLVVTSDIPINITFYETIVLSFLITVFFIAYLLYISKTQYLLANVSFMWPIILLWFISVILGFTNHYHKYDTFISVYGFLAILIPYVYLIHRTLQCRIKKL